jgi:galactokinase
MKKATKQTLGAAAATGAALAGAYYLFYGSKDAAKNRKQVAAWAAKAEKEIVAQAKKLKGAAMSDKAVQSIISEVARRYEATKNLDPKDVKAFTATMQKSWKTARKSFASTLKEKAAAAKKTAKKTAKKAR